MSGRVFKPKAPKRKPASAAPAAPAEETKPVIGGRLQRADGSHVSPAAPPQEQEREVRSPKRQQEPKKKRVVVVKPEPLEEEEEEAPVVKKKPSAKKKAPPAGSDDPLAPVRLEGRRAPAASGPQPGFETLIVQFPTSLPASLPRREDLKKPYEDDLRALKPGLIGKLQVLRSGKTRLILGDETFDVDRGLHCSMLQQLVAVHSDKLVVLGNVHNKLLVTTRPPDGGWDDDHMDDDEDD